jgi:phosphatidylserine decarboxylase
MTFESVNDATQLWTKGQEFTVERLLGDEYKYQVQRYDGGTVAIFSTSTTRLPSLPLPR